MSVEVKISIPKLAKLQAALKKHPQIAAKNINDAIKKSIHEIDRETAPLTPRLTGHLIRSLGIGKVFGPLSGRIFSDLPYAVVQHERTDFQHPRGGQAKYLEQGVKNAKNAISGFLSLAIERTFKEIKSKTG